jgi:hypothetical protein
VVSAQIPSHHAASVVGFNHHHSNICRRPGLFHVAEQGAKPVTRARGSHIVADMGGEQILSSQTERLPTAMSP